jgi:hypothetical protein
MNGISGGAPAQNAVNYSARPHIRSFSSAITFVIPGRVTNAIMSLKH